jgi:PAS domain S-box-containing protein
MAFGAYRRGRGMSRPFWLMVGAGLAMWGAANLGWTYYEVVLHTEPPSTSVVRFFFGMEIVVLAMVLLLDQEKDSARIDVESALDFVQIGIVFFFIYVEFYYLPAHRLDVRSSFLREMRVENLEDVLLTTLAGLQALRARKKEIRRLFGGLFFYLLSLTVCAATAQYVQSTWPSPTGTLRDLLWTAPFLGMALWAAQWQPGPEQQPEAQPRQKTLGEWLVTNATFALAPLIILVQVSQLDAEWRLVRFSLLGVSIVCYAVRLGISQFREARITSALQTHAQAMEATADGIAVLGLEGKHSYVNSAFARMMGFEKAEDLLGKEWRGIYDSRDLTLLEDAVRESLKQSGKWSGEVSLHRRNGSRVPLEMSITTMEQGGIVCVARDIGERLASERARSETEAKYKMFVEQVAAVSYIAEVGIHGEWLYVSPQVETIFGYKPEEWLTSSGQWMRYVLEEDHPAIQTAEDACFQGKRFQAEYRLRRKDGQIIWVSDTAVVVPGSDSHPLMEGIIVDITERRQLENQLQQARRMEAVGRLAGGVAHDFNNLLTIIRGYVELALNRTTRQPELEGNLRHISDASERAGALVQQLLAFSRKQVLKPKVLDLNGIVLSMDKLVRRLMSENIEMKTLVAKNIGTVKADPSQVEQVILNLIVNARDAMPDGGKLVMQTGEVELEASLGQDEMTVVPGRYVTLSVSDTGVGINAETLPHIFEPFYSTKESGRGTGLGLSTVYGIVKQSGGYISVDSETGKGTTFRVYLPRVGDAIQAKPASEKSGGNIKGSETILLVEDEPAVRELTRMVLAESGYTVISAANPEDAVRIAGNHGSEIHLLLTDVVMPGMSGHDLAKHLTAKHPYLRVLYMSGYAYDVFAQKDALEEGLPFLQKPFTPKLLAQRVRETLDRPVAAK